MTLKPESLALRCSIGGKSANREEKGKRHAITFPIGDKFENNRSQQETGERR